MRAVVMGPMLRFPTSTEFLINQARRRELPAFITLQVAGALCVSSDGGDDTDRAHKATAFLYSLKAGGLLETTLEDGRESVSPAALRKVSDRLTAAGLFAEGAQIWSDISMGTADTKLTTPQLKLALIGTAGRVINKKGKAIQWDDFIRLSDFQGGCPHRNRREIRLLE